MESHSDVKRWLALLFAVVLVAAGWLAFRQVSIVDDPAEQVTSYLAKGRESLKILAPEPEDGVAVPEAPQFDTQYFAQNPGRIETYQLVADQQQRVLREPVRQLLAKWNLGDDVVEQTLKALHARTVQQGAEIIRRNRNGLGPLTNDPDYRKNMASISNECQSMLLSSLGTLERVMILTDVATKAINRDMASKQAARTEQDKLRADYIQSELKALRAKHGANFEAVVLDKFGVSSEQLILSASRHSAGQQSPDD